MILSSNLSKYLFTFSSIVYYWNFLLKSGPYSIFCSIIKSRWYIACKNSQMNIEFIMSRIKAKKALVLDPKAPSLFYRGEGDYSPLFFQSVWLSFLKWVEIIIVIACCLLGPTVGRELKHSKNWPATLGPPIKKPDLYFPGEKIWKFTFWDEKILRHRKWTKIDMDINWT